MNEDDDIKLPIYIEPQYPGRNEPCPCGSGKKYKKCHGPIDDKWEPCDAAFWEE